MVKSMNELVEMNYENWFDKYQPYCENDQVRYYETYGEDYELIKSMNPLNVWTMLDNKFILNGRYFVNRLVYIATTFPWEKDQEIQVEYE
jgi:hypothetical protein